MFLGQPCDCGDDSCTVRDMYRTKDGMTMVSDCGLKIILPDATRYDSVEKRMVAEMIARAEESLDAEEMEVM